MVKNIFIFLFLFVGFIACGVKKAPTPMYSIPDSATKTTPTPTPSPSGK